MDVTQSNLSSIGRQAIGLLRSGGFAEGYDTVALGFPFNTHEAFADGMAALSAKLVELNAFGIKAPVIPPGVTDAITVSDGDLFSVRVVRLNDPLANQSVLRVDVLAVIPGSLNHTMDTLLNQNMSAIK